MGCFGVVWGFFSFLETARRENSPGCLVLVCRVGMDTPFASDPMLGCHKQLARADGAKPTLSPLFFFPFPINTRLVCPSTSIPPLPPSKDPAGAAHLRPQEEHAGEQQGVGGPISTHGCQLGAGCFSCTARRRKELCCGE